MGKGKDTSVKVGVRMRPLTKKEIDRGDKVQAFEADSGVRTILEMNADGAMTGQQWSFDHVFGDESTSADVYRELGKEVVEGALEGYNGCVFAYGQTASGKTFSMFGSNEHPGVIPSAVKDIFGLTTRSKFSEFDIHVSYIEVYNEQLKDLLNQNSDAAGLKITEDPKRGTYVKNAQERRVLSADDALALIAYGEKNRAYGATNMNARSSRSHVLYRVIVKRGFVQKGTTGWQDDANVPKRIAWLNFVDLAGSEKAGKTGATGDTLKEGAMINKSLMTLGTVINKLSGGGQAGHVPYRDSKLTHLLSSAIGGNATTAMLGAISPASGNREETLGTLRYASRTKKISNKVEKTDVDMENILKQYQQQIAGLKKELDTTKQTGEKKLTDLLIAKEKAEEQTKAASGDTTKLKKDLEAATVKHKSFEANIDKLMQDKELGELKVKQITEESAAKLKAQEKELTNQLLSNDGERTKLINSLREAEKHRKDLKDELTKSAQALEAERKAKESATGAVSAEAQKMLMEADMKRKKMEAELAEAEDHKKKLSMELSDTVEHREKLKLDLYHAEQKNSTAANNIDELMGQLEDERKQKAELGLEGKNKEEVDIKLVEAEQHKVELQASLKKADAERIKAYEDRKKAAKELEELREQFIRQQQEISDRSTAATPSTTQKNDKADKDHGELNTKLQTAEAHKKKLADTLKEAEQHRYQLKKDLMNAEEERQCLRDQMNLVQQRSEEEKRQLNTNVDDLMKKLDAAEQRAQGSIAGGTAVNAKHREQMISQLSEADENRSHLVSQLESLQQQLQDEQQRASSDRFTGGEATEDEREELAMESVALRQQLQQAHNAIERLQSQVAGFGIPITFSAGSLGFTVGEIEKLGSRMARRFFRTRGERALVVVEVLEGSQAASNGVEVGMRVVGVNNQKLSTGIGVARFASAVLKARGGTSFPEPVTINFEPPPPEDQLVFEPKEVEFVEGGLGFTAGAAFGVIVVTGVEMGGQADAHGVQVGMTVNAINDELLHTGIDVEGFAELLQQAGRPVVIKFKFPEPIVAGQRTNSASTGERAQSPRTGTSSGRSFFSMPRLNSPRLGSPRLNSPRLGSPRLGSPRLGSPRLYSPRLGSPRLGSPRGGPRVEVDGWGFAPPLGIAITFGEGNLGFVVAEGSKDSTLAMRFMRKNDRSLFVVYVVEGSQASQNGVEVGMKVLGINNTKLKVGLDVDKFSSLVLQARGGFASPNAVTINFEPPRPLPPELHVPDPKAVSFEEGPLGFAVTQNDEGFLVVTGIEEDGAADANTVEVGMIVIGINDALLELGTDIDVFGDAVMNAGRPVIVKFQPSMPAEKGGSIGSSGRSMGSPRASADTGAASSDTYDDDGNKGSVFTFDGGGSGTTPNQEIRSFEFAEGSLGFTVGETRDKILIVTHVDGDRQAGQLGVEVGMVIVGVNDEALQEGTDVDAFAEIVQNVGRPVVIKFKLPSSLAGGASGASRGLASGDHLSVGQVLGIPVTFREGSLGFTVGESVRWRKLGRFRKRGEKTLVVVTVDGNTQASRLGVEANMRVIGINNVKLKVNTDVDSFASQLLRVRGGLDMARAVIINFEPPPLAPGLMAPNSRVVNFNEHDLGFMVGETPEKMMVVADIEDGGQAHRAGATVGMVVVAINNSHLNPDIDVEQFGHLVETAGRPITVKFKPKPIVVELSFPDLGFTAMKPSETELVLESVQPGSELYHAGCKPGMSILAINHNAVAVGTTPADFMQLVHDANGRHDHVVISFGPPIEAFEFGEGSLGFTVGKTLEKILVVTQLDEGSQAARGGVEVGMIVTGINDAPLEPGTSIDVFGQIVNQSGRPLSVKFHMPTAPAGPLLPIGSDPNATTSSNAPAASGSSWRPRSPRLGSVAGGNGRLGSPRLSQMMDSAKGMMGMKPKTQNVVVKGIPVEFGPGNLGFTLAEDSKIGGSFAQRFSLGRRRNKMTLFVVEVADGGQASLAGVEPGMRVVAINGTKLEAGTDVDTFVLAVLHARGGLNSERNVTITFEPVPQAAGSNRQADVHVVTHPPMNPADDEDGPNVFKVEYDDGDA